MNKTYLDTARVLIQVAPAIFKSDIFALKGGTAINLFIRDMPRLSVDLDLVFSDHRVPREQALQQIGAALNAASEELRDISLDYDGAFKGMTAEPVELNTLLAIRDRLIQDIRKTLDENERRFLISMVAASPQWELLGIPHAHELPALQWKVMNLERLRDKNPKKFSRQSDELAALLQ